MAPCQASMSAATQNLALDLLQNALSSRLAYAVLGSVQSLTHEGARTMWRDGQHAHAPSTSMRGVVESHTLPECLMFVSLCFPSHKTFQDLTLYEVSQILANSTPPATSVFCKNFQPVTREVQHYPSADGLQPAARHPSGCRRSRGISH